MNEETKTQTQPPTKPNPTPNQVLFEDIHTPGALNQSPFALLGKVKVFRLRGKYILTANYTSRQGKLHILTIESDNEEDLLIKAIQIVFKIPTPWDRTNALHKIVSAYKKIIDIDLITWRLRERKRKEIAQKIAEIVYKYGSKILLRWGSTNLIDDDVKCYESFGKDVELVVLETVDRYRKTVLNECKEWEEELFILRERETKEIAAVGVRYYESWMQGLTSGGTQYTVLLPFRPFKIIKRCQGRICKTAEVGYEQEWREWQEEVEVNSPSIEIVEQVKQLLSELMSINS